MNISFENPDKVNGLLTITVEEADFKNSVEEKLKSYRKSAHVPGFRPGMVPMGLIKRQYEPQVRYEVVNKFVGEQLYKYVQDNEINMLGEPIPSEKQTEPVDLEKPAPYTFIFDIAVAPEIKIELNGKNKIDYYNVTVDDKLIDEEVGMYASRYGKHVTAEEFDAEKRDLLKGDLRELDADGNTKEGGITVSDVILGPQYIKVEEQKNLFKGAKPGDIITFNPNKAYPDNDAELSSLLKLSREEARKVESDFSYQVTEISRYEDAEVNQELFDNVFGKDAVKTEEEFRNKIAESIKPRLAMESEYKFMNDLREYASKKVGDLTWPDATLKRMLVMANKDMGEDYVEKNYAGTIDHLKWQLTRESLAKQFGIKLEEADVRAAAVDVARMQFAQYGMTQIPEEYLNNYADSLAKDDKNSSSLVERALDKKVAAAVKEAVKLNEIDITADKFAELLDK